MSEMKNIFLSVNDIIHWDEIEAEVKQTLEDRGVFIIEAIRKQEQEKAVSIKISKDTFEKFNQVHKTKFAYLNKKQLIMLALEKAIDLGEEFLKTIDPSFFHEPREKEIRFSVTLGEMELLTNTRKDLFIGKNSNLYRYLVWLVINQL